MSFFSNESASGSPELVPQFQGQSESGRNGPKTLRSVGILQSRTKMLLIASYNWLNCRA